MVSATLRHKTLGITADTDTSVLPEVAKAAAEAAAQIVPRQTMPDGASGTTSIRGQEARQEDVFPNKRPGQAGWGGWGSNPRPADYESAALTC